MKRYYFPETIAKRLTSIRIDHNLSRPDMAKILDISPSYWRQFENYLTVPSSYVFTNICSVFHIKREWLLNNEGPKYDDGYMPGFDPLGPLVDFQEYLTNGTYDFIEVETGKKWVQ